MPTDTPDNPDPKAGWVPIDFVNIPPRARAHLEKRIKERLTWPGAVRPMLAWMKTKPLAPPDQQWFKSFDGNYFLVGQGSVPLTVRTHAMGAKGMRISRAKLLTALYLNLDSGNSEPLPVKTAGEVFRIFSLGFDVDQAKRIIAARPRPTQRIGKAYIEQSPGVPSANEKHLDNVNPDLPGIVATLAYSKDKQGFSILIDGNHRAKKALQLGRDGFDVHVLTPKETWQVMAQQTYPQILEHFENPTKRSPKSAAAAPDVHAILHELFPILAPGLPEPAIKIVNQKNNWLGQDLMPYGKKNGQTWCGENTTIELQKKATGDENTLRRVLAHELCHHEDNLLNDRPKILEKGYDSYKFMQRFDFTKGHGPKWQEIAARFNARYGADFVTPKSDQSYVVTQPTELAPFFVLMHPFYDGKLMWGHASRLSPKMKSRLADRYKETNEDRGGYKYRLFRTTDPFFQRSPLMGDGSAVARDEEQRAKAQKLWDEGEDILAQFAPKPEPPKKAAAAPAMPPPTQPHQPYTAPESVANNENFKGWFWGSKVVDAQGKPLRVYRGDFRGDKLGDKFKKQRSTSGRFYFTDDPEIASKYSEKQDTQRIEENSSTADWFRFPEHRYPREKFVPNMIQAWYRLKPEERQRIKHVLENTKMDDQNEFEFDSGEGLHSGMEELARQYGGNWLRVAHEVWLDSGALFDEEHRFSELLDKARIAHNYDNPHDARSLVTPVYLSIKNPLDTSAIPQQVVDHFHAMAKKDRTRAKPIGYDQWDKSTFTVRDWVEKLDADLKEGTTHAWTVMPEKVTEALQALGYDGIKDTGGKNGGNAHVVWIAFEPWQIKSALGNKGTYDVTKDSIVASKRGAAVAEQTETMAVTETPAFKTWFSNSRVVDKSGEPLRVFHGTHASFDEFRVGANGLPYGFYFTEDPEYAASYTVNAHPGSNVMPVYLRITNPAPWGEFTKAVRSNRQHAIAQLKAAGYDGVITDQAQEHFMPDFPDPKGVYIVFSANQIKSAIGNQGTFDPAKDSIVASRKAKLLRRA